MQFMRLGYAIACLTLVGPIAIADSECPDECEDERLSTDVRIRYANVEDNVNKRANALTARVLMTASTPSVSGMRIQLAAEHVNDFGVNSYNDGGTNGQFEYAAEVDPSGTELEEAFVEYKNEDFTMRYGRQYINHGALPQRFLGTVAWRQNNQSYDALTIDGGVGSINMQAAFVEKVYRVLGRDHPSRGTREWDIDGIGIRSTYSMDVGNLTGYFYNLDFVDNLAYSTRTFGMEFDNACFDAWSGTCKAAFSSQAPLSDTQDYDNLSHMHGSVGVNFSNFMDDNTTGSVTFNFTRLEGDGTYSFKTPLATLHGYAGSSDKFLINTPATGLINYEVRVKEQLFGWNMTFAFHRFDAIEGPISNYGNEFDFAAVKSFGKYKLLLKMTTYSANEDWAPATYGIDATKYWTQLQFKL